MDEKRMECFGADAEDRGCSVTATPAMTPGEAIRAALKEKGWLQADLAMVLDITPATVSDLCQDRRGISNRMALALGDAFGNGGLYWASVQSAHDLRNARAPNTHGIVVRRDALIARKQAPVDEVGEQVRAVSGEPVPPSSLIQGLVEALEEIRTVRSPATRAADQLAAIDRIVGTALSHYRAGKEKADG
jgi:addiction module HigA family antidote